MAQRMEAKDYDALRRGWNRPPVEPDAARGRDTPATRVDKQEAASFGAFLGAFTSTKQRTGG